ncbi:TPA: plasmid replication initiation protein [Escherichia coli O103:H2]
MTGTEQEEISRLRKQLAQMSDLLDAEKAAQRLPKNMDFVQVSRAELRAIADLGAKSSLALDLLMVLAQSMDKQNAVMISFKAMQQILGRSRPTLDRAVRLLREDNWIQVVKVGTANAYVLNKSVFWSDRGDKKHLASFSAQVVTTLAEQDKDLRANPHVKLKRVPTLVGKDERVVVGSDELPPPDQQDLELN